MEVLFAGDFVLIAEIEKLLLEKLMTWRKGMEMKILRVNAGKTKVMRCQVSNSRHKVIIIYYYYTW